MAVIGINTLFLIPNKVGGTEYLVRSFLNELEKIDKKNDYIVFCNHENFPTFDFKSNRWKKIRCNVKATNRPLRLLYEQFILSLHVIKERCSVLHSFGYFGPVFVPVPHILTVHDANWRDHPEDIDVMSLIVLRIFTELNLFFAEKVVTDSEFSFQRLSHHFPWLKSRLRVVQPAVDEKMRQLLRQESKRMIKHEYFLCVSGFYPHKGIPNLIRTWKEIKSVFPEHKLVLVGQNGLDADEVMQLIANDASIQHFSKVQISELVSLYKYASCLLFPSEYEGFGYPVYEAVEAGISVVVRNKEMFDVRLNQFLQESDFTVANLKKLLGTQQKRQSQSIGTNKEAAQKLKKLYEEI